MKTVQGIEAACPHCEVVGKLMVRQTETNYYHLDNIPDEFTAETGDIIPQYWHSEGQTMTCDACDEISSIDEVYKFNQKKLKEDDPMIEETWRRC